MLEEPLKDLNRFYMINQGNPPRHFSRSIFRLHRITLSQN